MKLASMCLIDSFLVAMGDVGRSQMCSDFPSVLHEMITNQLLISRGVKVKVESCFSLSLVNN